MMRSIGTYFKVVDADEHRIIEELRSLRERKRKEADDRTAADAAKAKSIRIREGYARANELRKNKTIEEALIPQVLVDPNIAMIENFDIVGEDDEAVAAEQKPRRNRNATSSTGKPASILAFTSPSSNRSILFP